MDHSHPRFKTSLPPAPPTMMHQPGASTFTQPHAARARVVDQREYPGPDSFGPRASLPGLNFQSYNHNSQQPQLPFWPQLPAAERGAFSPAAFLSQFAPPPGFPIPPPPPPGLAFPGAPPPLPFQNAPLPGLASLPAVPPPMGAANERVSTVLEVDREDGELSESDPPSISAPANDQQHTMQPRSIPLAQAKDTMQEAQQQSALQDAARTIPSNLALNHAKEISEPQSPVVATPPTSSSTTDISQMRKDAQGFVKLLHENQIGYAALAEEGLDPHLLHDMYCSLNLPSQPAPIPVVNKQMAAKTDQPSAQSQIAPPFKANGHGLPAKPVTALKTNNVITPPATTAASPIDRKDYIARLQATRLNKQAQAMAKSTPPTDAREAKPAPPSAPTPAQASSAVPKGLPPKPPLTAEEKARKNALLKAKLEKLRAETNMRASAPGTPKPVAPVIASQPEIDASNGGPAPSSSEALNRQSSTFGQLPGLFMNSAVAVAPPSQSLSRPDSTSQEPAAVRKRPVASDFDEAMTPQSLGPTHTRPLGQSPHDHRSESLIIEVSEDESSASDMEVDEVGVESAPQAPPIPTSQHSQRHPQPGIPGSTSRATSALPTSSAADTPPIARTPFNLESSISQHERETQILKLKLQIAEAESRRKKSMMMKGNAIESSPARPQREPIRSNGAAVAAVSQNAESVLPPSEMSSTDPMVDRGIGALTGSRRLKLEADLQSLAETIGKDEARLLQIEAEMDSLRSIKLSREREKEDLLRELETLGSESVQVIEGGCAADKANLQTVHDGNIGTAPRGNVLPGSEVTDNQSVNGQTASKILAPMALASSAPSAPVQRHPRNDSNIAHPVSSVASISPQVGVIAADRQQERSAGSKVNGGDGIVPDRPNPISSESLEEPVTGLSKVTDAATPVDDEEDFYSPEPPVLPSAQNKSEHAQAGEPSPGLPSEADEMEMSESSDDEGEEEEDYEPEEASDVAAQDPKSPHAVESAKNSPISSSSCDSSDHDGETYEPPEPDRIMADVDADAPSINNVGSAPVHGAAYNDMDVAMSSSTDSSLMDEPTAQGSISALNSNDNVTIANSSMPVADDLAPHLQAQNETADAEQPFEMDYTVDPTQFVPYESPLRMFKAYRNHSKFPEEVKGGYSSMTYSHQIDPQKPLCEIESLEGECTDEQCDAQHFRDMKLSGDKLLVQLGTANPGKTPEEKSKWTEGLRQVLKTLRSNNIKDPNGIALEIAKYRRQFLNDDSRVLNL